LFSPDCFWRATRDLRAESSFFFVTLNLISLILAVAEPVSESTLLELGLCSCKLLRDYA